MISEQALITFFSSAVLLALMPGPDNLFVLSQSMSRGPWAGIFTVMGFCTGLLVHTTAVALGIAVIFKTSMIAFTLLKVLGAIYLAWLGFKMFRSSPDVLNQEAAPDIQFTKLYLRGVVMNIANPKVSLFFLAFLPQFADPGRGNVPLQIASLGALFIIATIIVFGSIALFAGIIGSIFTRSPRIRVTLNRLTGVILIGIAVKLVMVKR